jgi:hypothetical protein
MEVESFINTGQNRSLRPILNCWIETNLTYLNYFDLPDSAWWYNERATLSTLSAAVWKTSGVALEEYPTEKGKEHEAWSGRCDLFIGIQSHQFACEAKQAWCPIGRNAKKGIANAKTSLQEACNDARKLDKGEGRRLGICFAVPYLPPRDEKSIDEQLEKWLYSIYYELEYDSIAWLFPKAIRTKMKTVEGYFYPGVVLIIKEIYRKT